MNQGIAKFLVAQSSLPAKKKNPIFKALMCPLSLIFRVTVRVRNFFYDVGLFPQKELPGLVVSVGNIHAGGVGKTPFVIGLCAELDRRGSRAAVLTRGYRHRLKGDPFAVLMAGKFIHGDGFAGDEAMELSLALPQVPIVIGANRFEAAMKAKSILPEVQAVTHWIMDDGFQHRKLWRDVDVVLLPADRDLDEDRLMPLGTLREQPASLSRAGVVALIGERAAGAARVTTMVETKSFTKRITDLKCVSGAPCSAQELKNDSVAVCGLGNAKQFFDGLKNFGVNPKQTFSFTDHHEFSHADFSVLPKNVRCLITTRKDFLRSPDVFKSLTCGVYVAELTIEGPFDQILAKLQ
jgi:tetraacyldisaccharide 4'-kinase